MKKLGIALIGLVMAASSCQAASWNFLFNKDKAEIVEQEKSQQPITDLKGHIQAIYADVRRNYPADHSGPPKNDVDLDVLYCSTDWNRTVESIKEKDAQKRNEMGFFEADYWIMGQDWGDLTPQDIQVTMQDDSHAVITFEMDKMGGSVKKVQLNMVYEQGSWRIDNFIDRAYGLDWKQSMREYLAE